MTTPITRITEAPSTSLPTPPVITVDDFDDLFYHPPGVPSSRNPPPISPVPNAMLLSPRPRQQTRPLPKPRHTSKKSPRPLPALPTLTPIIERSPPAWTAHRPTQSEEIQGQEHRRLLRENRELAEALSEYLREKARAPVDERPVVQQAPMELQEPQEPKTWLKTFLRRIARCLVWR